MRKKRARTTVLVADDDSGIRNYLKMALEHLGFRVQTCSNGTLALRKATSGKFGLLLLDYWMGVPNGFEVLMHLRERGFRTPVILVSSGIPDPIREHCESERLAVILGKPFTLESLRKSIDRALS